MSGDQEVDKSTGKSLRGSNLRFWLRCLEVLIVAAAIGFGIAKAAEFRQFIHNKMRAHGCINNLGELGLVCHMWKAENGERWPALADVPGEFMLDHDALREYLSNPTLLRCPLNLGAPPSDEFPGDAFYIYLGPGLETEEEALAFLDAYLEAARAGKPLPSPEFDAEAFQSIHGKDTSTRLSEMPVAFDRPKNHNYESINVLDANGNVQWRKMGTTYPATKAFWDRLEEVEAEIDRMGRPAEAPGPEALTGAQ